jgi:HK97 family phage prohead protease
MYNRTGFGVREFKMKDRLYFDIRGMSIETRGEDKKQSTVKGEAIVFNRLSRNLGGFKEEISPDSVDESLEKKSQKSYWNHNSDFVLGSVRAGTLRLDKTDTGVAFEIDMPDSDMHRGFLESIRRGDVDQMSFGFRCLDEAWSINGEDEVVRTVKNMDLIEVSPVANPAYPQTSVSARDRFGISEDEVKMLSSEEQLTDEENRAKMSLIEKIRSQIEGNVPEPELTEHERRMANLKLRVRC